jgi:hypothetical protein
MHSVGFPHSADYATAPGITNRFQAFGNSRPVQAVEGSSSTASVSSQAFFVGLVLMTIHPYQKEARRSRETAIAAEALMNYAG